MEKAKKVPSSKVNQKLIEGEKEVLFFRKLATIMTDIDLEKEYDKSLYKPYLESKLSSFYLKYQLKQFLSKLDSLHDIVLDLYSFPLFDTIKEDKKEII